MTRKLSILLLFIIFTASCKKGWIDINYDPAQASDQTTTPDLILAPLLLAQGDLVDHELTFEEWMGYWCYPNYTDGNPVFTYDIKSSNDYPAFAINTSVILLEQNAVLHEQPYYVGIAKVLRALQWSMAVDLYNNMPYHDAIYSLTRTPRYESGQAIYEDLMVQLDSAVTLISNAPIDKALHISQSDIMFKGDKTKWYKFINTLKLRLLVHQANRPERAAYIKDQIAKINAQGAGFMGTGEDASVNPGFTQDKPSPYFYTNSQYDLIPRSYLGLDPSWVGASANTTALDMLKQDNDPRLGFFYSPVTTPLPAGAAEPFSQPAPANFRGNRFGLIIDQITYPYQTVNYISQIGGVNQKGVATSPSSSGLVKGYDMPCWIISSVESLFLQAEAIQRGWLPGDPEQAYLSAVKESFRWLNVGKNSLAPALSDNIFQTWYDAEKANNNANVSWSAAPDKYKLLMYQKYMAMNGVNPFETYVDYRRNGSYPDIPLSYNPGRVSDKLPIRAPYDDQEYVQNPENVNAQGVIDVFTSKIWWMP